MSRPAAGLGPKQLAWCEARIPAFKAAREAAEKARAASEAERERLERAARDAMATGDAR